MACGRSGFSLTIPRAVGSVLTALFTACVPSAIERVPVPTTDRWRVLVAGDETGTVSPEYPLDVTAEMVEYARRVAGSGKSEDKLEALQEHLFDHARFPFEYSKNETYTAIEAFERRQGNCVSFTMLFIALARAVGVDASPALLRSVEEKEQEGQLTIINKHVVAVHRQRNTVLIYDFAESREGTPAAMRVLEDNWITAMFLNNLGVQDLLEDRLERARERLEMAVAMAGDFAMVLNNLGVVYRRQGEHEKALNAYVLARNGWGASAGNIDNLRLVYQAQSGYEPGARLPAWEDLPADVTDAEMVRLGHAWMARGRTTRAMQMYDSAAELAPGSVQPVLAKARVELYRRRPKAAIRSLSEALSLESDHPDVEHLTAFLKLQRTTASAAREVTLRPD